MTPAHFILNKKINAIAGNNPVTDVNDMQAAAKIILAQQPLITSEYEEFVKGLRENNIDLIRDGLADIIVTCDGMLSRLGVTMYDYDIGNDYIALIKKYNIPLEDIGQRFLKNIAASVRRIGVDAKYVAAGKLNNHLRNNIIHNAIAAIRDVTRFSVVANIDVMADQTAVFVSNLSKFDTNIEVAKQGVEKYKNLGVSTAIESVTHDGGTYYVIKSDSDQIVNGKDYPKGKFLKSVLFQEPVWKPIANNKQLVDFVNMVSEKKQTQQTSDAQTADATV